VARAGAVAAVVGECSANPYRNSTWARRNATILNGSAEDLNRPHILRVWRSSESRSTPAEIRRAPCIRSPGIPEATVIGQLAAGRTHEQILPDSPELEPEDIPAALEYAAEAVQKRELLRRTGAMVT
jgi:uncharacterized protein (DUF433 family)